MSRKLYEITGELHGLLVQVEEADGELTSEIEAALEEASIEFAAKAEGILGYRQDLLGDAKKFKEEVERLKARRETLERTAKSLGDYLRSCMEVADIRKMQAGNFLTWRQANPERVEITNEEILPEQYLTAVVAMPLDKLPEEWREIAEISPNLADIKEDYKFAASEGDKGFEIPGAELVRGEHLRVK